MTKTCLMPSAGDATAAARGGRSRPVAPAGGTVTDATAASTATRVVRARERTTAGLPGRGRAGRSSPPARLFLVTPGLTRSKRMESDEVAPGRVAMHVLVEVVPERRLHRQPAV